MGARASRHLSRKGVRAIAARLPRRRTFLGIAVLWSVLGPGRARAQEPPDTLAVPADSLLTDSLAIADSLAVDSLPPPFVLPRLPDPVPATSKAGIWEWDRAALLGARAQTAWELLTEIPGVLTLRGGDLGAPQTAFPIGYSGGGLRVFHDGVEHLPLDGSVPDLSRVPLSGLERIRVIRTVNGLEVHLFRLVHRESEPYSLIEAGTGDLGTNILRGTFSAPRALRGKLALAIERLDTQGRGVPGAITGGWFRYSAHRGDRAGLLFEVRRMGSESSDSAFVPGAIKRSDWTLKGNWSIREGVLAEAWATGASIEASDSTETFPFAVEDRGQYGVQLSGRRGALWGRTTARFNTGSGVADQVLTAQGSAVSERWGGLRVGVWSEGWDGASGSGYDLRAWVAPTSFLSLFVERGDGSRSVPFLTPLAPVPDTTGGLPADSLSAELPDPEARFTRRTGTRVGAELAWRRLRLSGARLSVEADSIWPTGLALDRGGVTLPQPVRSGWEITGNLPLWPSGLSLRGGVQLWEAADSALLYFPDHLYHGSLTFHDTFLPSGNFELWLDLGAQGRPGMTVPVLAAVEGEGEEAEAPVPATVPFYQNWFFRLQMRIVSVNIFATIENLSLRDDNQDAPGLLLPRTRSMYGIRWTLWN